MKKTILLTIMIGMILSTPLLAQRMGRYVTGDLRFHDLESTVFGNTRKLRVFVPEGYNTGKQSYPVLYLNDGQNLFDPRTSQSPLLEWGVDETVLSLTASRLIEPIIVVGIDNAGEAGRANEYLPWKDLLLEPSLENPQGSKYPAFLTDEVVPFIEAKYRTKSGAENRGIGGSTYGALISLYTVLEKPGVFGKVILESPTLEAGQGRIITNSESSTSWPARIYLSVGTSETEGAPCDPENETQKAVIDSRRLEKILTGKSDIQFELETCSEQSEITFGRRFSDALEFLFPFAK